MKPITKQSKPRLQETDLTNINNYNNKGGNKTMENEKTKYVTIKPQDKEVFICMSDIPYKSEPKEVLCFKGTDKEELKTITNYGLYVKSDMESKTFYLTITKQMYKNLCEIVDLKDKKIIFSNYEHDTYGTLLSVKQLR